LQSDTSRSRPERHESLRASDLLTPPLRRLARSGACRTARLSLPAMQARTGSRTPPSVGGVPRCRDAPHYAVAVTRCTGPPTPTWTALRSLRCTGYCGQPLRLRCHDKDCTTAPRTPTVGRKRASSGGARPRPILQFCKKLSLRSPSGAGKLPWLSSAMPADSDCATTFSSPSATPPNRRRRHPPTRQNLVKM
jgi:hypothetical protein